MRGKLLGAGGDGIDTELLSASPEEVLEGQVFYGEGSEEPQTGTMTDHQAVNTAAGVQQLQDMLKVFLFKGGYIREGDYGYPEVIIPFADLAQAVGLAAEFIRNGTTIAGVTGTYGNDGNLTPETLVAGKIGYGANGRVAGEAVDRGSINKTLLAGERYDIAKGFYGNGVIAAKDLASQTGGTAGTGDILKDKISWVNGNKVIGNIVSKAAETFNVSTTDREIAAALYLSGKQTIKGVYTEGISAGNIKKGVRVRVGDSDNNGRIKDITGTFAGTLQLNGWWYKGTITERHPGDPYYDGYHYYDGYYDWRYHGEFVSNQLVNNQVIGPGVVNIRNSAWWWYHNFNHNYEDYPWGMLAFGIGGFWYVKCRDTSQTSIRIPFIEQYEDITLQIGI